MTQVNISDAKEHFNDWLELLLSGQQDEFLVIKDGEPVARISPIKKVRGRYFGMAKNELNLPPDFDKNFDAMDAEILDMFDADWGFKAED